MSIPLDGGVSKRLFRMDGDYSIIGIRCARWPDTVCVTADRDGDALVVRPFHLDGSREDEVLRVAIAASHGETGHPSFDLSPDGSKIVVTENTGRIRVFDLKSGESRELASDWGGRPQSVYWSANGEWLYISGMYGLERFWIVRLDLEGGFEFLWKSEDDWAYSPVPSPDDRSVVFQMLGWESTDIWMIEGF